MKLEALRLYMLEGLQVREIADRLQVNDARARGLLGLSGIRVRESGLNVRDHGRETVCAAVRWKGYNSFHEFVQSNGLLPLGEQAAILCVSERAFVRIYEAYRRLLEQLASAGRPLFDTEQRRESESA